MVLGVLIAAPFLAVHARPNLPRWIGVGQVFAVLGVALVVGAAEVGLRRLLRLTATGLVALGAFLWVGKLGMVVLWLVNEPFTLAWAVAVVAFLGAEAAGQAAYRRTKQTVPLVLMLGIGTFAAWMVYSAVVA